MSELENIPSSVYRLQLSEDFPLKKAIDLISYLHLLGIEGVYCSPIFKSASSNGYDVINPNQLNPKLGTIEEYETFCTTLKKFKMKQILDVVPNHMGIKGDNQWWLDVLENGPDSFYADVFDIDWNPLKRAIKDKILLPILGNNYGKCLENQEITLTWENHSFWIKYGDYRLPVARHTYLGILKHSNDLVSFFTTKDTNIKENLVSLYKSNSDIKSKINELIDFFNGKKGDISSFHSLHELLEKQYYRLALWKVAGQEINYRRFFNINELVAIHIENEKVLREHHAWIFQLIESKKVEGLRVDHPDGLYRPEEYFDRVRQKGPSLIVVEKILDFKEQLPSQWNVEGSVGYDFLSLLNALFIKKENENQFSRIYEKFINQLLDFTQLLNERKKSIMRRFMGSELNSLGWRLDQLSEKNIYFRDFTRINLTEALKEIVASFPVYRTYLTPGREISKKERDYIIEAVEEAKKSQSEIDFSVFNYIKDILLLESPHLKNETREAFDFVLRFQQLTPPITAKALEDSIYYLYNRFISLNEVGSNPANFGITKGEFDNFNQDKLKKWPLGFLATSTHDSKFSEDVRMRLNVLSEIPDIWEKQVFLWKEWNKKYKQEWSGSHYPDDNLEYYLYQMLIGVWPINQSQITSTLLERLWKVVQKIARESAIYTSWSAPNENYEKILKNFFIEILTNEKKFFASFLSFQNQIALFGRWNSLSSLILKMGSCGIVDIFQGCEHWNFSLVDPDNRNHIDYNKYKQTLIEPTLKISDEFLRDLFVNSEGDKTKQFITASALTFRRKHKKLFLKGNYLALDVVGEKKEHIIAFLRHLENEVALVIASRFLTKINPDELPLQNFWKETFIVIPKEYASKSFHDILTQKTFLGKKRQQQFHLPLEEVLMFFPFSILEVKDVAT